MCGKTKIISYLDSKTLGDTIIEPLDNPVLDSLFNTVKEFISDKRLKVTKKIDLGIHYRKGGYLVLEAANKKGDYTQVTFSPVSSSNYDEESCNLLQSVGGSKKCFINIPIEDCVKKTAKCLEQLRKVA